MISPSCAPSMPFQPHLTLPDHLHSPIGKQTEQKNKDLMFYRNITEKEINTCCNQCELVQLLQ